MQGLPDGTPKLQDYNLAALEQARRDQEAGVPPPDWRAHVEWARALTNIRVRLKRFALFEPS